MIRNHVHSVATTHARAAAANAAANATAHDALGVIAIALTVVIVVSALAALAGATAAHAQALPNPYRQVEGWAKLPGGRQIGAVGDVDIDVDGRHVWAVLRCDAPTEKFGYECLDSELDIVVKFAPDGNAVESFGGGMFIWPHGLEVDPQGNVWVTDAAADERTSGPNARGRGHQVVKFSPTGEVLMRLGTAGVPGNDRTHFNAPSDIVVAPNGDVFVADGHGVATNNRVVKFGSDGRYIKEWGGTGTGPGQFRTMHAIAIDARGRVFIGDRDNNRIQLFDQEGTHLATWTQFGRPSGIFFDHLDRIVVADSESDDVENPGWDMGLRIGDAATGAVHEFILYPWGDPRNRQGNGAEFAVVDLDGNIYGGEPQAAAPPEVRARAAVTRKRRAAPPGKLSRRAFVGRRAARQRRRQRSRSARRASSARKARSTSPSAPLPIPTAGPKACGSKATGRSSRSPMACSPASARRRTATTTSAASKLAAKLFAEHYASGFALSLDNLARKEREIAALAPDFVTATAFSGLNQALYDLLAKREQVPVWQLFRNATTVEGLPLYTTINRALRTRSAEEYAAIVGELQAQGFKTFKCAPFEAVNNAERAVEKAAAGLATLARLRERFPDLAVRVDFHERFQPQDFFAIVPELERLKLDWIEEPFAVGPKYDELRSRTRLRISGGELFWGRQRFAEIAEHRWCDVIMPDVKHVGGFGPLLDVLKMGAGRIEISPHNPSGPISTAASLHAAAVYPDLVRSLEYSFQRQYTRHMTGERIDNGVLVLGDEPGWGVAPQ